MMPPDQCDRFLAGLHEWPCGPAGRGGAVACDRGGRQAAAVARMLGGGRGGVPATGGGRRLGRGRQVGAILSTHPHTRTYPVSPIPRPPPVVSRVPHPHTHTPPHTPSQRPCERPGKRRRGDTRHHPPAANPNPDPGPDPDPGPGVLAIPVATTVTACVCCHHPAPDGAGGCHGGGAGLPLPAVAVYPGPLRIQQTAHST